MPAAARAALGRERPRISVVIPTIGRSTLARAVASAAWADEVIVVYDAAEAPMKPSANVSVYSLGPTGHWGAEQRNLGITRATGTHLAFLDDDDVYTEAAGTTIRRALTGWPGRVHIFRMQWGDRVLGGPGCLRLGAIGTPMFIVPNDHRVGRWTTRYEGDFDFIDSTLALHGKPRFHNEIVAVIRPPGDAAVVSSGGGALKR